MSVPPGTIPFNYARPTPTRAEDPNALLQEGQYETSVPTVADRVAQTVVAMYLEPKVEPAFHPDSYGYRPKRSALDAVGRCRERCWSFDWVIDLDIQKFFDTVPWDLVLRAVEHHTGERWILLYVKRWLHAPLCGQDGTPDRTDHGYSARLGDLTPARQPVHALRVRCLDGTQVPLHRVRTVCG